MIAKAKKTKAAIPAVGYLRKSTAGKVESTGRERQEKSIPQQQREIEALAESTGYKVIRWYADPGISGWKRGAKRPDFQRMLLDAREKRDFKAILCDDLDRFSRAKVNEVSADGYALNEAGVRYVVTASQGEYDLGGNEIGGIIKFVVAVWSANEFSRKLGRRIALSRRNRANEGKRSGGIAPFGLANDGAGGLQFGDREHGKIVRRLFAEFVTQCRSLNGIAGRLNAEKIPAPRGGRWHVACVRELLQQPAYAGDFAYNRKKSGQFAVVNEAGEVVEADAEDTSRFWKNTSTGVIAHRGKYKSLIDPALFAQAQERLASFSLKGNRRPREGGYPLSRILVCDHCGKPMYGCQPTGRNYMVYRCSTNAKCGMGTCGTYEIRESLILPFVLKLLGEEIADLSKLLQAPPDELRFPRREQREQHAAQEKTRADWAAKIARATDNLMFCADPRTRKDLDARVTEMRDELERLDRELAAGDKAPGKDYTRAEMAALTAWWEAFEAKAVTLPVSLAKPKVADVYNSVGVFWQDRFVDHAAVLVGRREINEALHRMGCEVRLRWRTERITRGGKEQNRYRLARGRIRLGEKTAVITGNSLEGSACGTVQLQLRRGSLR
jgi:site-specific DNA recombinase